MIQNASHRFPESPAVVLDRPVAGEHMSLDDLVKIRTVLLEKLTALSASGGAVLLPFDRREERMVEFLLMLVWGNILRRQSDRPLYFRPIETPFHEGALDTYRFALIHCAPRVPGIEAMLQDHVRAGKVVLATGLDVEWQKIPLEMPYQWFQPFPLENGAQAEEFKVADSGVRDLFLRVAACDAWGVLLPTDLLPALPDLDKAEIHEILRECGNHGPLYQILSRDSRTVLLATGGENLSVDYLQREEISPKELFEWYEKILDAADPARPGHRYTVMRLFHGWLTNPARRRRLLGDRGRLPEIRALVRCFWETMAGHAESAPEHLAWARLITAFHMYPEADQVLLKAIEKDPRNPRLLQARAVALGRWALLDSARAAEARRAFEQAAHADPKNMYILQSEGVFEASMKNWKAAGQLLGWACRESPENVFLWTARADLAIDEGRYAEAEGFLNHARTLDPASVVVTHLEGRVHLVRGAYVEAAEAFSRLLGMDRRNVHALHSFGQLARVLGRRPEEADWYRHVLRIDPENIPALHGLANHARRLAEVDLWAGRRMEAQENAKGSAGWLLRLFEVEAENPAGLATAAGVCLLLETLAAPEGCMRWAGVSPPPEGLRDAQDRASDATGEPLPSLPPVDQEIGDVPADALEPKTCVFKTAEDLAALLAPSAQALEHTKASPVERITRRLLVNDPANLQARHLLGLSLWIRGRENEAILVFQELMHHQEMNLHGLYSLAGAAFHQAARINEPERSERLQWGRSLVERLERALQTRRRSMPVWEHLWWTERVDTLRGRPNGGKGGA